MTLLRLAFECPHCGTRPNWRIFEATRKKYAEDDPDEPTDTWQCQGCGETHVITARAYQEAA